MKICKIIPFLSERIWGGKKAKERGFNTTNEKIGEVWAISAHENGMSNIIVDEKQIPLKEYFESNREKFNNYKEQYPLLNKILLPEDYLSIQVHPNDEYALKHHNSLGKPESWYILEADKDAKLIYGHNVNTKDEFIKKIEENKWDEILTKVSVKAGDFLNVPDGKIHAVGPGVVIYEIQRSSDITYRLYDYDRKGVDGKPRELHIKESLDNIKIPDTNEKVLKSVDKDFFSSKNFNIYLWNGKDQEEIIFNNAYWLQLTVLSKTANINGQDFKIYESLVVFDDSSFKLKCNKNDKIIISYIEK